MRVVLTFIIREIDRPIALSQAIAKAVKAGLARPQTTRCSRRRGAWVIDVAGRVKEAALDELREWDGRARARAALPPNSRRAASGDALGKKTGKG